MDLSSDENISEDYKFTLKKNWNLKNIKEKNEVIVEES